MSCKIQWHSLPEHPSWALQLCNHSFCCQCSTLSISHTSDLSDFLLPHLLCLLFCFPLVCSSSVVKGSCNYIVPTRKIHNNLYILMSTWAFLIPSAKSPPSSTLITVWWDNEGMGILESTCLEFYLPLLLSRNIEPERLRSLKPSTVEDRKKQGAVNRGARKIFSWMSQIRSCTQLPDDGS